MFEIIYNNMASTKRSSGLNPVGLHKTATCNDLIDHIVNDKDKIVYPNRFAKQLRSSFSLSQLDGEGMRQMEIQQINAMKEQQKEHILKQFAMNSHFDHGDISSLIGSNTHEVHMPDHDPEAMDTEPPSYNIAHDLREEVDNFRNTASAEQQVMQNQMAQRDAQNAMNVRNELSQQLVGHERQTQELRDYLETGQRRQVQEVESRAEQYVLAEQQKHKQELQNVRQSNMAQQTAVPMETQPLDEPQKAIKHTATPTSTPPVKSKAKAMPSGLNSA